MCLNISMFLFWIYVEVFRVEDNINPIIKKCGQNMWRMTFLQTFVSKRLTGIFFRKNIGTRDIRNIGSFWYLSNIHKGIIFCCSRLFEQCCLDKKHIWLQNWRCFLSFWKSGGPVVHLVNYGFFKSVYHSEKNNWILLNCL